MYRLLAFSAALVAGLLLLTPASQADDWTTVGGDAQRSSWVRADIKISTASVAGPDFQFLWKMELDNEARGNNALTTPVLIDFLISHWGFRSLAFVGASSGGVFVIDTDLTRPEWERRVIAGSGSSSRECPGGITANLTRPTAAAMPSIFGISARGRRSPARGDVGKPGEGAVQLSALPPPTTSPGPTSDARVRAPARASLSGIKLVYALAGDGRLHSLYVSNGRDRGAPKRFLPPNANASGLIVVDDVAYVATRNGCGDAADGVWSLDLGTDDVTSWKSQDGSVAGAAGVAFGPDGTVYAATHDGPLVALAPKTLERKAATPAIGFRSSPVVLDYRGDDHVAALDSKGAIQLYAADDLSKPLAGSPSGSLPEAADTALAAWRDAAGATWILAPAADSIVAWELVENGPARRLQKGWESPKMTAPLPPIVVNGVVFALDGGNASKPAKLYALDGGTGKPIWDSGSKITSYARGHTLSSGPGHVYLTTHDSAVYAFGFPMEH